MLCGVAFEDNACGMSGIETIIPLWKWAGNGVRLRYLILLQNPPRFGSMGKRSKVIYAFERAWGLKEEGNRGG